LWLFDKLQMPAISHFGQDIHSVAEHACAAMSRWMVFLRITSRRQVMGNLRYALLPCSLVVCFTGVDVQAQILEIGGSIGVSCKGSDGSLCNETHSGLRTAGPYASVWFEDQLEVTGRVAWLQQPDLRGLLSAESFSFAITDRRRLIAQGEIRWHFRSGRRVRPHIGLGFGGYRDREVVTCEPSGCESRLSGSGLHAGATRALHSDQSVVAGVSVALHKRARLHGGWRYHNPFKDELALSELFVAVGYRPF
jgi:hypothetical protein